MGDARTETAPVCGGSTGVTSHGKGTDRVDHGSQVHRDMVEQLNTSVHDVHEASGASRYKLRLISHV